MEMLMMFLGLASMMVASLAFGRASYSKISYRFAWKKESVIENKRQKF